MSDERPTHIDLFSGIGGFALAAERVGWATRLFVEKNEFCQRLLRQHWKEVPIISDIKEFDATGHRGLRPKRERGGEVPAGESGWSIEGTWEFEPDICRVAHGVSKRVDRLTALGNAIVPGIAEEILRSLVRSYEARR